MTKLKIILASLFIIFIANTASACDKHAIKLTDILSSYPEVSSFKPSQHAFHASLEDSVKEINGEKWELRYFTFIDGKKEHQNMSFADLVKKYNLTEELELKNMSYGDFHKSFFFSQNDELADKGVYFFISLARVNN